MVKQLSNRGLISHATTLVKQLSSRSNPAALDESPNVAKAVVTEGPALRPSPHAPVVKARPTDSEHVPTNCEMIPIMLFLIMALGAVIGWVPLLVTGVVYYTHPIPGNNHHLEYPRPMPPHFSGSDAAHLTLRCRRCQEIPPRQRTTAAGGT
jgi:hypothetical protein